MKNTQRRFLYVSVLMWFLIFSIQIMSQTIIKYESTDEIFFNPERGFTAYRSNTINQTLINTLKSNNISVIQRIYTIPKYNSTPLPSSFLSTVQSDFNSAREGGVKVVPRFAYTDDQNGPDAALDTILLHISQLAPILQENSDVIAYVEAGFIGAWGEWYYSSHKLNNTVSRRSVVTALLNALPLNRGVVVRTPDYKRKIFEITSPLDYDEAFSGTPQSRTGAHNDCFLADATDYGTYTNIEADKKFLNLDNRFVPQGGETCCDCGYAGCENALKDLERLHWSLLNKDYHPNVMKRWVTEGCMDEVKRRLGYRLELQETVIPDSIKPSGKFEIELKIANKGFASPFNPRNLEIILRNKNTGVRYRLLSDEDPRLWLSGDTSHININAGIPSVAAEGEYGVYIFLADPEPSLHDIPDYAIRLANKDLWEDSTGYNYLNHQLIISTNASGENYTGDDFFQLYNGITDVAAEDIISPEVFKIDTYPNPFNGMITVSFNINPSEIIDAGIFDILGRAVKQFEYHEYRSSRIIWNAANLNSELTSGIYFFTIRTKENIYSKKIVFLK